MKTSHRELLLSQRTASQTQAFLSQPANALLISGPSGSGKAKLAKYIAANLLGVNSDSLHSHPYFNLISKPENKAEIPIETIRELIKKLDLRVATVSDSLINRIAVINDAQYLSTEAQNALLKLLEEPPHKSLIILTASSEDSLLPTVASRTQKIIITQPSLDESLRFFDGQSKVDIESNYRLSRGAAGLLEALLSEQDNHSLKIGVSQAKCYITADSYNRLIQLQTLAKDKLAFGIFLDGLSRVLAALNEEYIIKNRHSAASKILATRQAVEQAASQVQNNSNIRLVALSLLQKTKI
jgi:DNA polymerase III delta prime subunit